MPRSHPTHDNGALQRSFRQTLQFYLIDCKTPIGKLIDVAIIVLNLAVCALYVCETYVRTAAAHNLLWRLELGIVFFFVLEYAARLYAAENRWRQLRDIYSLIDLIAILPTLSLLILPSLGLSLDVGFIKIIRSLRVFRIFRFLRFTADAEFFFGKITHHLLTVLRLTVTILMIFFISAGLFFQAEHTVNPAISNFGDAFYFTVVALTTVGFGDITPASEGGRWVTVLMIVSGIILIPWQASRIVKEWFLIATKNEIICPQCGLRYHDKDASHCKSCGQVIYQQYDGL